MIELTTSVEVAACLGGYVVKTTTFDPDRNEDTVDHRVVFTFDEALGHIRTAFESQDKNPTRDYEKIEAALKENK